ncbi:DUF2274 domain-containing protein [Variovorax sp. LT1R16]|uniref:DUF2274 domain-containing protein n=1 Tax=Variovorax sp. LT1R16 TaxID=3443728 RepID=UPI003F4630F1
MATKCPALGPVPKAKTFKLTIVLPAELKQRLERYAQLHSHGQIHSALALLKKRVYSLHSLIHSPFPLRIAHEVDPFHEDLARRGRLLEDHHDLIGELVSGMNRTLYF